MLVLTLPYPVSANRYWQSFVPPGGRRAIVHLSTEAKRYRKDVAEIASQAGLYSPMQGRLHMHLWLYPQRPQDYATRMRKLGEAWDDSVRCIDLGNAEKVLSDALQGIVFEDDGQIWRHSSERMEPDAHGARVVVQIWRIVREPVQAELLEAAV